MKLINICSFTVLCIFGIGYILKLVILLKKNNIRANVFGKGDKSKKTIITERFLKLSSFLGIGVWIINSLFPQLADKYFITIYDNLQLDLFGIVITSMGVVLFIVAMISMKTSWRVGIDKSSKTTLVKLGIYKYSRNPAFVGMDLMFMGTTFTYNNLITIGITIVIALGLHLQILQEEKHMAEMLGEQYYEYVKHTPRYLFI